MSDRSSSSTQLSLWDSSSVISSPEFPAGPTPCASPAGPTIAPSGPPLALASRSARPARGEASTTSATSGPSCSSSSASAALQSSLESRLRHLLAGRGSTLYRLTWKVQVTPSGRPIFALLASGHRTSDSGSTSSPWPTPTVADSERASEGFSRGNLTMVGAARLSAWPTPTVNDSTGSDYAYSGGDHSRPVLKLPGAAKLATGWPTPTANGRSVDDGQTGRPRGFSPNLPTVAAMTSVWPTTRAADGAKGACRETPHPNGQDLPTTAGWATPTATEPGGTPEAAQEIARGSSMGTTVTTLAHQVHGAMPSGYPAPTGSRGQLNPDHSRWLMAFPREWAQAAPWKRGRASASSPGTATPSSRKSRRRGSEP